MTVPDPWSQGGARVRFEWGASGLAALLDAIDGVPAVVVVVDVLSFSTAVVVAADAGVVVQPVAHRPGLQPPAPPGALLAGVRGDGRVSLSPGSLAALPAGSRVVLPSPNGAAICTIAEGRGATVLIGAIRNAAAVGDALVRLLDADPAAVGVVIAAGERWPDGSLRPALEDLAGSALILERLPRAWLSAEARVAAHAVLERPELLGCASARELVLRGFEDDVEIALDEDASEAVPSLITGWITAQRH